MLLITAEGIDELTARGYPLYSGALGENLTTRGLDRRLLRVGQQFRVGLGACIEITNVRGPCATLDVYGPELKREIYDAQVKAGDLTSPRWGTERILRARCSSPDVVRADDIIDAVSHVGLRPPGF